MLPFTPVFAHYFCFLIDFSVTQIPKGWLRKNITCHITLPVICNFQQISTSPYFPKVMLAEGSLNWTFES